MTSRLRFRRGDFEKIFCQSSCNYGCKERAQVISKNLGSWYVPLVDFEVPHTIQPREYSKGDGTDGSAYERVAGFAVNVNWNADNRKWNVNDWNLDDNQWNRGNRVFSRNSRDSPAFIEREFSSQYP